MEAGPTEAAQKAPLDVLVVGAGFAGLAAAKLLGVLGLRATVVEARDRLGGRAFTDEFSALEDASLEAGLVEEGCNYLHGCDEEHALFVLAHRLGVPSACCPADLCGRLGGWESQDVAEWRDAETSEAIPLEEVLWAKHLLDHVLHGLALQRTIQKSSSLDHGFELALEKILEAQRCAGLRATADLTRRERGLVYSMRGRLIGYVAPLARMPKGMVRNFFSDFEECRAVFTDAHWPGSCPKYAAETARRVQETLDEIKNMQDRGPEATVVPPSSGDSEDRLLLGEGFGALIRFLAEGADVVTGARVESIDQSSTSHVSVHLESGQVLSAAHVIVTLPVGVLAGLDTSSAVSFKPALPEAKVAAVSRLALPSKGAPTHEKVVLRWHPNSNFVTKILGASGASLQFGTTDTRFHFLNLHKYGRRCQLLCHIWADADWREHSELPDAAVVAEVVAALRAAFAAPAADAAAVVEEPLQSKVTRWALDPFTLGAYSEFQSPEASERDRQAYARTEGRLLFAGEGAVPGAVGAQCTHGAFVSGITAALEVWASRPRGDASAAGGDEGPAGGLAKLLDEDGPCGLNVAAVADLLVGRAAKRAREE